VRDMSFFLCCVAEVLSTFLTVHKPSSLIIYETTVKSVSLLYCHILLVELKHFHETLNMLQLA